MASIEKYNSDQAVLYQLRHDFRSSPKPPRNTEIFPELTRKNYSLHPEHHGRNAEQSLKYYKRLLNDTYIYGKNSDRKIVRCLQWSIQAPSDLAPEQKPAFFKACYSYLNNLYGEENCIAAVVHVDEIMLDARGQRISHDHLHYLAVPRVSNDKYLPSSQKLEEGLSKLHQRGILTEREEIQAVKATVDRIEQNKLTRNEAISEIARNANRKYTDARKIFNAVVRKDSEAYKTKLNSDALTSRRQLHEFHPGLQKHLDDLGIHCTVSYKSQGINKEITYTIDEAKTVTRITGRSIEEIKELQIENKRLHEQVKSLTREIENTRDHEWGDSWGENQGTKEWEKEKEY